MNKQDRFHIIFLNIAEEIAKMSNCVSLNVGCVITYDNRIISTGYNGTPSGTINCNQHFTNYNKANDRADHSYWSEKYEIHAEMNAILNAAFHGRSLYGSSIYSTHQPCHSCLKNIIGSGISNIYYRYNYDRSYYDAHTYSMIEQSNINLVQIENIL